MFSLPIVTYSPNMVIILFDCRCPLLSGTEKTVIRLRCSADYARGFDGDSYRQRCFEALVDLQFYVYFNQFSCGL